MTHQHVEYGALESIQEGIVIDENPDNVADPAHHQHQQQQSGFSCGLPYYRWLHPHAKTKRLQYFNQILPDIYSRTAHLLPEWESFDELVKEELPRRWRDKDLLQTLRRRLFVATKYWGRFRNKMGRNAAFDNITIQNGMKSLRLLQADTAKAVDEKEKLLRLYVDDDRKPRKGYEERKEYTEEMMSILSQIRSSVDGFIEELDKLLQDAIDREKLSDKDLDKARTQLKKRREKEAKKKQRKREQTKKQKTVKGPVVLAASSDIAALTAAYGLEPSEHAGEHPILLPALSHALQEQHALLGAEHHHNGHAHALAHAHLGHDEELGADEEDDGDGEGDHSDDGADSPSEENRVIAH